MKNVLLAGTALLGVAIFAAPAQAQLNLDLGGHFRGYVVYSDDEAGSDLVEYDLRRDVEIHFTGETTLDNGLTVGVHVEQFVGDDSLANTTDEVYAYFSGNWGRVNFGSEDGAAYLLQVAAPSADSNVDGLRTNIQAIDTAVVLDYAHADFKNTDRLTYLTPKFNGFQAGVSYAFEAGQNEVGNNLAPMNLEDIENLWEVAARWDGEFEGLGLSLGAGYSRASDVTVGAATDTLKTWNVGANVAWNQFAFGGAYLQNKFDSNKVKTWVVGAAWDNGPYHVGVSYLDKDFDGAIADADRLTIGGGYAFGPGMSFRGAVAFGDAESASAGGKEDFTQVTIGTDIQF